MLTSRKQKTTPISKGIAYQNQCRISSSERTTRLPPQSEEVNCMAETTSGFRFDDNLAFIIFLVLILLLLGGFDKY